MALTVAYLAVAKRLNARTTAEKFGPGAENVSTEPDTRYGRHATSVRSLRAQQQSLRLSSWPLAPSPDSVTPATQPAQSPLTATIKKPAASAASRNRRITSVDCPTPVAIGDNLLLTCAVMFEGTRVPTVAGRRNRRHRTRPAKEIRPTSDRRGRVTGCPRVEHPSQVSRSSPSLRRRVRCGRRSDLLAGRVRCLRFRRPATVGTRVPRTSPHT